MDTEEFAKWVLDVMGTGPWPEFKRGGWYNEAGLQVEYYHEKDSFYGDWVDHFLTLYREHKDDPRSVGPGRMVGCNVSFDKNKPACSFAIHGEQLFLDEYVAFYMKKVTDPVILEKYKQVLEMIKGVKIDLKESTPS